MNNKLAESSLKAERILSPYLSCFMVGWVHFSFFSFHKCLCQDHAQCWAIGTSHDDDQGTLMSECGPELSVTAVIRQGLVPQIGR